MRFDPWNPEFVAHPYDHFCLGAPLARIEPAESFGALLRGAPEMELAAEPAWGPGYVIRGLTAFEVRI